MSVGKKCRLQCAEFWEMINDMYESWKDKARLTLKPLESTELVLQLQELVQVDNAHKVCSQRYLRLSNSTVPRLALTVTQCYSTNYVN